MNLPEKFLNRMKLLLDDFDEFVQSYQSQPVKSFFINNHKIADDRFLQICSWNISKCERGWKLLDDIKVGKTPEHHSGMVYMQELSAMMPASFLPLKGNEMVLDMCASPGGKTIQVANRLPLGRLVSNEIVRNRANVLKSNIERMGLSNVCVINNDPLELENCFGGVFDAVVVDAPCSGEGMFRKDQEAIINWSEANVHACAIRQRAILETANKMLRQNGYLLYSTCTFSVDENEGVVADFCKEHDYQIVPLNYAGAAAGVKIDGTETRNCLRFYPHRFNGEGQFVALLKKLEPCESFVRVNRKLKPLIKSPTEYRLFKDFCAQNLHEYDDLLDSAIINDGIIYYANNISMAESSVRLVNCGVVMGEIVKNRFEPNHNFAMSFGQRFKQSVNLTEDQAYKFIRGETLDCVLQGVVVVKYNDCVLGFGKGAGVLKNHYPRGLRNV